MTAKERRDKTSRPPFDMDAIILSSATGVCLDEFMHLRWKDYEFDIGCLHFRSTPDDSGVKLFLNDNMCGLMRRRYNSYVSNRGHAPLLGENIFDFERKY